MQPLEEGGLQLLYCGDIAACFTKPGAGAPSYFLYLVNLSFGNCTKCRYMGVCVPSVLVSREGVAEGMLVFGWDLAVNARVVVDK